MIFTSALSKEQLHNLIALCEGSTPEFKRAMPSDLGRKICAFVPFYMLIVYLN